MGSCSGRNFPSLLISIMLAKGRGADAISWGGIVVESLDREVSDDPQDLGRSAGHRGFLDPVPALRCHRAKLALAAPELRSAGTGRDTAALRPIRGPAADGG